jgi:anti-sigma regulatory factor (Ser/Thr protein kinase)
MEMTSASYAPNADAAHESRSLVRSFLARQGADDLAYVGEGLISELVSNVVRHAHSDIRVELGWDDETLRLEVRDGSSILPAVVELANEDGGYGLRIVEAFAEDWGVRPLAEGKAVWCTVNRGSANS